MARLVLPLTTQTATSAEENRLTVDFMWLLAVSRRRARIADPRFLTQAAKWPFELATKHRAPRPRVWPFEAGLAMPYRRRLVGLQAWSRDGALTIIRLIMNGMR